MPETIGDKTIGEIVAADFRAAQVFTRYGIDFCCNGQLPLAEVCEERSLNLQAITQELAAISALPSQ